MTTHCELSGLPRGRGLHEMMCNDVCRCVVTVSSECGTECGTPSGVTKNIQLFHIVIEENGSGGRTRTYDPTVNSRLLYH